MGRHLRLHYKPEIEEILHILVVRFSKFTIEVLNSKKLQSLLINNTKGLEVHLDGRHSIFYIPIAGMHLGHHSESAIEGKVFFDLANLHLIIWQ